MTLDEYLKSAHFLAVQDEALRDAAIRAVETIRQNHTPVKRHQLHAIPSIIQGSGLTGLRYLAQKQKEKNSTTRNKEFWAAIDDLLSATSSSETSLFGFLQTLLLEQGLLEPEASAEKNTQKQIRKRNRTITEGVMDEILNVYFEHFNCHYFIKAQQGGSQ